MSKPLTAFHEMGHKTGHPLSNVTLHSAKPLKSRVWTPIFLYAAHALYRPAPAGPTWYELTLGPECPCPNMGVLVLSSTFYRRRGRHSPPNDGHPFWIRQATNFLRIRAAGAYPEAACSFWIKVGVHDFHAFAFCPRVFPCVPHGLDFTLRV